MNNKEMFSYWVMERENIRFSKEHGDPKPWSNNRVMQSTYFCNVDREQDKVTKWIRQNYHYDDQTAPTFTANMILARMVNKPESLAKIGFMYEFDTTLFQEVMSQQGSWGSAYIVSTNGRAMPKHEYIAGLLETIFKQFEGWPHPAPQPTLRECSRALQAVQGLGSFMSAQVIADLKNTPDHPLWGADDWWTWASHGPGSLRGLEWFHERRVTPSNFMEALVSARQWCYTDSMVPLVKKLCNQNLQNCFCEYDKFMRVTNGTGRSKRGYNGA